MKKTVETRAKVAKQKLAARVRVGNAYALKTNISKAGKKYSKPISPRDEQILIGSKWEKHEAYKDKLGRRVSTKGIARKVMQGLNEHSRDTQFPAGEMVNGTKKHRYFKKHGVLVDRLA